MLRLFVGSSDSQPGGSNGNEEWKSLADRFVVPPFSVLDARQGYWQNRKRAWLSLGIRSEIGRGMDIGAIPPNERDILSRSYKANATPGGSPLEAATLGKDGKAVRGDGKGRPLKNEGGRRFT